MLLKLAGWLLVLGFLSMEQLRRGEPAKSVRRAATDRGTSIVIMSAYALALLAMAFNVLPGVRLSEGVAWAGIGLGVGGFALRFFRLAAHLGRRIGVVMQSVFTRGGWRAPGRGLRLPNHDRGKDARRRARGRLPRVPSPLLASRAVRILSRPRFSPGQAIPGDDYRQPCRLT
jgi:hypothetical protein